MMKAFTSVVGAAAPLMLSNVDTDVIIRIDRLTAMPAEGLGPYALEALRYHPDGSEIADFVLNQPAFRGAPILLADVNFGCGSSREGAVSALQAIGIRVIVAPSYGDIFYSNCIQNGVLPIRLPAEQVAHLATLARTGAAFMVDLGTQVINAPDGTRWPFAIQPLLRETLLEGLDPIGLTLKHVAAIRAWEAAENAVRPWTMSPGSDMLPKTTS